LEVSNKLLPREKGVAEQWDELGQAGEAFLGRRKDER
jgi:hypothetical protein